MFEIFTKYGCEKCSSIAYNDLKVTWMPFNVFLSFNISSLFVKLRKSENF